MYNQTVLNPIAFVFTLIMCIAILSVNRKYIIVPLLLVACFIPNIQRISIAGIDFSMLRIITIFGLIRIAVRKERLSMTFNSIDKIIIYYSIIRIVTFTILWSEIGALIFILGQLIDTICAYFFIRFAIYDFKEYDIMIKTFIISSMFIAIFMTIEHLIGGTNLFHIFGAPEMSEFRNGRLRAEASLGGSIMAGTFGATILPISWASWKRNYKHYAVVGIISSITIIITSSSSGPIISMLVGIFGISFWLFNNYTRIFKILFFLMLIILHFVMEGPIWHLIARIDLVGGSTGYHRYRLIDAAVNHFFDWALFGVQNTAVWGHGLQDVTNQYILEGVRGGITPLLFFIIIISKCFQFVGKAIAKQTNIQYQKLIWGLGVVLLIHAITFLSISYYDQMVIFYYLLIAMISSLNNIPEDTGDKTYLHS